LADALIGGVASVLDATVVTRNRPDFERQGIPVLTY
jgi:predicted nucleic acid-binding protein